MPFTSPLMLGASGERYPTATITYSDDRDANGEVFELTAFSIDSDPDNILDIISSGVRGVVSVNATGQYRFTLVSNYSSSNTAVFETGTVNISGPTWFPGSTIFNLDTASPGDTSIKTITNDTSSPTYDGLIVNTSAATGSLTGSCTIKVEYLG